ncbi:MAG: M13 family peptidase [Erysipelotrichia bacterium]|nr:M13 family peptidase [Erysipelotrichia bacterium]
MKLTMKKISGYLLAPLLCFSMVLGGCAPSTASATPSAAVIDDAYATREYAVSEFVQSVGRNNLNASKYVLSTYSDADQIEDDYITDYQKAADNGIVQKDTDNPLRPLENVTKIEALVYFSRILPEDSCEAVQEAKIYTDVPEWAQKDIEKLSAAGYLDNFTEETLGADDKMTEEDIKSLTDISDSLFNTVTAGESFYGYINNKAFRNVSLGDTSYVDAIHGAVISNDNSWSAIDEMYMKLTDTEGSMLNDLMDGTLKYEDGTPGQRIHDLLECIQNSSVMADSDIKTFKEYRQRIIDAQDIEALVDATNGIYKETGIPTLLSFSSLTDPEVNDKMYPAVGFVDAGYGAVIAFCQKNIDRNGPIYIEKIYEMGQNEGLDLTEEDAQKAFQIQMDLSNKNESNFLSIYYQFLMMRSMFDETYSQDQMTDDINALLAEHPNINEETMDFVETPSKMMTNEEIVQDYLMIDLTSVADELGYHDYDSMLYSRKESMNSSKQILSDPSNLNALKLNALLALSNSCGSSAGITEEETKIKSELVMVMLFSGMELPYSQESDLFQMFSDAKDESVDPADEDNGILSNQNIATLRKYLPFDIGMLYCENYYDEETGTQISDMIEKIWNAYLARFENNTWMSESTKKAAEEKIYNMVAVIGYPDNLTNPVITSPEDGGTLFSNTISVMKNELNINIRNVAEEGFFRTMMAMSPDTVNANYNPGINTFNIYAGILNPPVYDKNRSEAANLGAVGMVIAHEIGHAFDASGANYDANGVYKNWWTDEDHAKFLEIQNKFIEYYKNFSIVEGVTQDSEQTIQENMADIAGIQVVMDVVGDNPDDQREALQAFAEEWAMLGTEKSLTSDYHLSDNHSIAQVRVNACVSTLDNFYDLYDISEDDPMYVAPEDRLRLW